MDWAAIKNGLVQTALATMFAGAAGYLFGTSQTAQIANDVTQIKTGIDDLKLREDSHDHFAKCAELRLYTLESGMKTPPDCAKDIGR